MEAFHALTLVGFLAAGAFCDIRDRHIPNRLVALCTFAALGFACATGGVTDLCWSAVGFLLGVALLFGPFALGFVGAGDAKFLGVIGAFFGPRLMLHAFVAGTIMGGVAAIPALWQSRGHVAATPGRGDGNRTSSLFAARRASIPYAVPLALGAAVTLARSWIGG